MARPRLKVADILNRHGDAFLARHRLSRGQMKVFGAIRACRTAALGGHVVRCEGCDHVEIAYNSCRIRRFLLHVLPDGFHRIRHYGLFASGARAGNIARIRSLLAPAQSPGEANHGSVAATDAPEPACPCCGGRLIIVERFRPGDVPRTLPNVIRIDTS